MNTPALYTTLNTLSTYELTEYTYPCPPHLHPPASSFWHFAVKQNRIRFHSSPLHTAVIIEDYINSIMKAHRF